MTRSRQRGTNCGRDGCIAERHRDVVTDMNKWRVTDTGHIYKDEVEMNYREKGKREMVQKLSE